MAFKSAALSLLLLVVAITTVASGKRSTSESSSRSSESSTSQEQDWCSSDCQSSLQGLERKIDQLQTDQNKSESNTEAQLAAMNRDIQEILTRARCPASFTYDSNSNICIQLFTERVNWDEAARRCQILGSGSRLAVLDTVEKATFVRQIIQNQGYWVWLGGQREGGQFKWTTGQEVGLPDMWRPNEPTQNGDCLFLSSNQGLGNLPCSNLRFYFCDVPLV